MGKPQGGCGAGGVGGGPSAAKRSRCRPWSAAATRLTDPLTPALQSSPPCTHTACCTGHAWPQLSALPWSPGRLQRCCSSRSSTHPQHTPTAPNLPALPAQGVPGRAVGAAGGAGAPGGPRGVRVRGGARGKGGPGGAGAGGGDGAVVTGRLLMHMACARTGVVEVEGMQAPDRQGRARAVPCISEAVLQPHAHLPRTQTLLVRELSGPWSMQHLLAMREDGKGGESRREANLLSPNCQLWGVLPSKGIPSAATPHHPRAAAAAS